MSRWERWQRDFHRRVKELESSPFTDDDDEKQFFEIELGLRLRDHICPDAPYTEIWPLLSGYRFAGINARDELFAMCMKAGLRIRFLLTAAAWEREAERYMEIPATYRLYEIELVTKTVRRLRNGFWPERIDIYDTLLLEPAPHIQRHTSLAQAGTEYTFTVDDNPRRITIPEAFIHKTSAPLGVASRHREPLDISFDDLLQAAAEMDEYLPDGNWTGRMSDLQKRLAQNVGGQLDLSTRSLRLDGIYNLIGIGSSGKSTLLWVLTYYLTTKLQLNVGIITTTLVDSVNMAESFIHMQVKAAPVSGHDRAGHRLKFGQAHKTDLLPEDVFRMDAPLRPALQWMSGPCAIAGMTGFIPLGQEPCTSLKHSEKFYACPLLLSCPLHQARQDLADATVSIPTPASFLYTQAPEQVTRDDMRTLEFMYRECDVMLFDEPDLLQTRLDAEFAPTNDLRGASDEAILSVIDSDLSEAFLRNYARTTLNPSNKDQKKLVEEARHFADLALDLLRLHTEVAALLKERPLSLMSLFRLLASQLWTDEHGEENKDNAEKLYTELWDFATRQTGKLAEIVNDVTYKKAGTLVDPLCQWLSDPERKAPIDLAFHPSRQMLLLKLEFSICLASMDRRFRSLIQERVHAGLGHGGRLLDQMPPPEYQDLVPNSPFGTQLGYQFAVRKGGPLLQFLQSRGIGRWILLHFHELFNATDNIKGPHAIFASATGFAPGSPQFHIHVTVSAVLSPPEQERQAIEESSFKFFPVPDSTGKPIRVSGTYGEDGQDPYRNLELLTRYLAEPGPDGKSILERDFDQGRGRLPALIVNSYPQVDHVQKILQMIPYWHNKTIAMKSDTESDPGRAWQVDATDSTIRRGEIERLREKGKKLPIFPLLAFQRGYNVLDDQGKALLGSAYFLVRPFPHPDDASLPVIGANAYTIKEMVPFSMVPASYGERATEMIGELRRKAYHEWMRRMPSSQKEHGLQGMKDDLYKEYLWDQFIIVWQTCLRFFRGGRSANIYFVDGAFHPMNKTRSTLTGWIYILDEYLAPTSSKDPFDRQLVEALYGPAYRALKKLEKELS